MLGRIWLIGGTSESSQIAQDMARFELPCTVTVTTPTAQTLYPQTPIMRVRVGQLHRDQLHTFLTQENIVAMVDSSHPYAVQVSQMAIDVARERNIPYIRYERPLITSSPDQVIELESFNSLVEGDYLLKQRVLLTVGYKALPLFQAWQNRAVLFARILPSVNSLEVAHSAGFTSDRLIALRPPISAELEKALWKQWQISLVVTKASGQAAGEHIKRHLAGELGISLIVIARPVMNYPQQTSDLVTVINFCRQVIQGSNYV